MSDFAAAVNDYRYLRERLYPAQAALKLVGDRYRLSASQRNLIFRGALARDSALSRQAKVVRPEEAASRPIGIDWYNVLITVESYLKGVPVFLADDGVVRDAAAAHGGYRPGQVTDRAIDLLLDTVVALQPARVDLFLDAPVTYSGDMAAGLRLRLRDAVFASAVEVVDSPDYALKRYEGLVASSDSAVLDHVREILDLPRCTLSRAFGFEPPDLASLGSGRRA